jgi:hypothetical protein
VPPQVSGRRSSIEVWAQTFARSSSLLKTLERGDDTCTMCVDVLSRIIDSVASPHPEGPVAHVNLRFTRHARNRMRLYGITTEDVEEVFRDPASTPATEGNRVVLWESQRRSSRIDHSK